MTFLRFCLVLMCLFQLGCSREPDSIAGDPQPTAISPFASDNLCAWCVVPFDNQNREPQQRIEMLKELGFTRYAYDWRERHLETFAVEIDMAAEQGIEMMAVWIWIDAERDKPGKLSAGNERILETIASKGLSTEIWVGFHSNYFSELSEDKKLEAGVEIVSYLSDRASQSGNSIALYNHGDWAGLPGNQVKIIERLPNRDIGIVFNFHHAHEYLDRFDEVVEVMAPHLTHVNLNGMQLGGPKILPIGSGDQENQMIQKLLNAGYSGPFGILGHVEDRDVEKVLKENLEGLAQVEAALR